MQFVDARLRAERDEIPAAQIADAASATYEGPGKLDVRLYRLTSEPAGLDVVQRRRPTPETIFLWQHQYFLVVDWPVAKQSEMQDALKILEDRLHNR